MKKFKDLDLKYNFKIYLSFLKEYKFAVITMLLIVFILEVTYAVDKYLFKILIDEGTEFVNLDLARSEFVDILLMIAVVFIILIIIRFLFTFLKTHIMIRLESKLIRDLKRRFFNHIIHLSHNFHSSHKTGSLISRLLRGSRAIEGMTDVIVFNFSPMVFQLIVVFVSIVYFDFTSAMVVLLTVTAFIVYSIVLQNRQKEHGNIRNRQEDYEKAYLSDVMTNIDSIKYFGKEVNIKRRFSWFTEKTKDTLLKYWSFYRWLDSVQILILGVGTFFLIYFPAVSFLNGELTLGTLVFIFTVFGNLGRPLYGFVWGIRRYYESMIDFEDLFQYGKIVNEIEDKYDSSILKIRRGEIEFKDVTFGYRKDKIFKEFDLKIEPNQKVAIIGHSGCGKTTLVKLLYRLYDVERGQILIDGKDIRDFKQESLRSELSIVPQECILFDDTIYNNIAFSKPGASRMEVMRAIRFAQLDRVIAGFPKKERTIVGERGVKLSGGEKQRVSIARAILADKKVLVLDEATSSLDSETEYEIQKDLLRLTEGRTAIMIAHRLSTIMHADKIVVMDKGKIVQIGTHNQLLRQKGEYRKLWNLQKGGYIK
ncbi:MAG: ABC transporter ATP-binding protein [archaeon]